MNVLLLGALWFAYAAVRNLAGDQRLTALANASRLLDIESSFGVDIERALQSAVDWPHAYVAANTYYLLHFPLTLAVIALAFRRRRSTLFPVVRNSLIGCTAIALAVHLVVPMAPPRMLPGFVDTGAAFGPDPYAIAGSESANQFAAMPSMHVAWAILAGYAIVQLSGRGRFARVVGFAHPVLTAIVVVVTGHHFVSDVAIGTGLALGFLLLTKQVASGCHEARHVDDPAVAIGRVRAVSPCVRAHAAHRLGDAVSARTRRLRERQRCVRRTTGTTWSFTMEPKQAGINPSRRESS